MLKENLKDTLLRNFKTLVFERYGAVAVVVKEKEDFHKLICMAYDCSVEEANQLAIASVPSHVVFYKTYDLSSVDFNSQTSVSQRIHEIVRDMEQTLAEAS